MADPVAMRRVVLAVPGSLETPTGGYRYDRRMAAELAARGWRVDVLTLGEAFPAPDAATLAAAYRALAEGPPGAPILADGLALGAMPEIGRHLDAARPLVALVHHPLAFETGLTADRAAELRESERRALAAAAWVIATSAPTARALREQYGVPAAKLSVAPPGVDAAPAARADHGGPLRLLAVGAVTPRKGHDRLVAALADVADLDWTLTIAGDATLAPAAAEALRRQVAAHGLGGRVRLAGAVAQSDLDRLYADADLFVLASRFEGYGMVFSEALARGLPVVATAVGAATEIVPHDAGLLVPPDDAAALARALRRMIGEPVARAACAAAARRAAASLPRWSDGAEVLHGVLGRLVRLAQALRP